MPTRQGRKMRSKLLEGIVDTICLKDEATVEFELHVDSFSTRGKAMEFDAKMSQTQLDSLGNMLRPSIARILGERTEATEVRVLCTQVHEDDMDGAAVLRFEVRVRGIEISAEQEARVIEMLRAGDSDIIVKTKTLVPPVY